jgi:hypothetical protein
MIYVFRYGRGSFDNDYLDNFNNGLLNKYEKNLKNKIIL